MSKPFYIRLNTGHYWKDTYHLRRAAEHGAYLLLLMALFDAGGRLKASDANLAAKACCSAEEWAALKPVILPFFKVVRGWLTHKRIDAELEQIATGREQRREAGRSGGVRSGETRRRNKALREAAGSSGEANASQIEAKRTKTESESQKEPKPKKASGARRCPPEWALSADLRLWAYAELNLGVETINAELARFRDHEFPRPYTDWDATFRNWLRRAAKDQRHARTDQRDQHRPDPRDARRDARLANYAAAERGARLAAGLSPD